jgi:hypothetical protein
LIVKQQLQCFFSGTAHPSRREIRLRIPSHVFRSGRSSPHTSRLTTSDPPPRRRQVDQSGRAKIFLSPPGSKSTARKSSLLLGMGKAASCQTLTGVRKYLPRSSSCFPCSPYNFTGHPDRMPYPVFILHVTLLRSPMSAPAFVFLGTGGSTDVSPPLLTGVTTTRPGRACDASVAAHPGTQAATKRVRASGPPCTKYAMCAHASTVSGRIRRSPTTGLAKQTDGGAHTRAQRAVQQHYIVWEGSTLVLLFVPKFDTIKIGRVKTEITRWMICVGVPINDGGDRRVLKSKTIMYEARDSMRIKRTPGRRNSGRLCVPHGH